ncbi:hypothetical protein Tco_0175294 [Tanacetum coccineum]
MAAPPQNCLVAIIRQDYDSTPNPLKNCANRAWRRRQDFQSDGVMDLAMASGRSQLKVALEDSTWRRRQDYNTMPSG